MKGRPDPLFALSAAAGLLVLTWLYFQDAPVRLGLDTFHHLASVRELARGEFPPRRPGPAAVSPRGRAPASAGRRSGSSPVAGGRRGRDRGRPRREPPPHRPPDGGGARRPDVVRASHPRPARLALLAALPALGIGLAALWLYYPLLRLLKAFTMPQLWEPPRAASAPGPAYAAMAVLPWERVLAGLRSLGPAAAGLVWSVALTTRRQPYLLLWAGLDFLLAAAPLPFHQRFLIFALLPLQVAAAGLLEAPGGAASPGTSTASRCAWSSCSASRRKTRSSSPTRRRRARWPASRAARSSPPTAPTCSW